MHSDQQLVQAIRKGDQAALGHLVQKYKNAVYGVIFPKVRNFHQAEDLASETFLEAYQSLKAGNEPEKLSHWLYGIARNLTSKWLI